MPMYEYRCKDSDCAELETAYRRVDDRDNAPSCPICGGEMKKIISGYHVHGDFSPYYDDNLQAHITSRQHRKQVMKQQGVEEHYGQGWHTSAINKRKV